MKKENTEKEENLIHVKIGYDEGVESKKNLLNSEINLLNIAKIIRVYRLLRIDELRLKLQIIKKMKSINLNIKRLEKIVPKVKIPEKSREVRIKTPVEKYDNNIEKELRKIQEKLNTLQQ